MLASLRAVVVEGVHSLVVCFGAVGAVAAAAAPCGVGCVVQGFVVDLDSGESTVWPAYAGSGCSAGVALAVAVAAGATGVLAARVESATRRVVGFAGVAASVGAVGVEVFVVFVDVLIYPQLLLSVTRFDSLVRTDSRLGYYCLHFAGAAARGLGDSLV